MTTPLINLLFLAGPLLLAQHELLDLARRGLGQLGELDGGGGLEAGDALLAEVYYLVLRRLLALLQDDERFGALAPLLVGYGHDGGLHDGRVAGDGLLHLDGRDVLTTRDDDVLVAVPDLHVPIRVPHGHVARVVPAAFERFLGGLLVLEVAFGYHVAVHHDLTHRLPVALDVVHVFVDHTNQISGRVALTLPGHQAGAFVHLQLFPLGVDPARGHRAVGLGEAVDVHRTDVQLEKAAKESGGGRSAGDGRGYGRL